MGLKTIRTIKIPSFLDMFVNGMKPNKIQGENVFDNIGGLRKCFVNNAAIN